MRTVKLIVSGLIIKNVRENIEPVSHETVRQDVRLHLKDRVKPIEDAVWYPLWSNYKSQIIQYNSNSINTHGSN